MHFRNALIKMKYKFIKKILFCLPFRKADDSPMAYGLTPTASSLSRTRSRRIRLRPWRLEYEASSTFAQLGYDDLIGLQLI